MMIPEQRSDVGVRDGTLDNTNTIRLFFDQALPFAPVALFPCVGDAAGDRQPHPKSGAGIEQLHGLNREACPLVLTDGPESKNAEFAEGRQIRTALGQRERPMRNDRQLVRIYSELPNQRLAPCLVVNDDALAEPVTPFEHLPLEPAKAFWPEPFVRQRIVR